MDRGYIKLWRKTLDSGMLKSHKYYCFFSWCMLRASYKKRTIFFNGVEVTLNKGELIFGRKACAEELSLSAQEVRTLVSKALRNGQISTIQTTSRYTIYSVINWDTYQGLEDVVNQPNNNEPTSFQPASNQLSTSNQPQTRSIEGIEGEEREKGKEIKSNPLPKPRPKKDEARTKLNREVWESYKNAFFQRYGVDPVRNAKINGMISKYTQRLPADEAAAVAAYYVFHQGNLYVQSKHCVDLLLRDAEKLRADWATGTQTTQKPRSKILEALAEANRLTGVSDETEGSPRLGGGNSFQLRLPR